MRSLIKVVLIFCVAFVLFAQVPKILNYQGKLTDSDGVGIDGTYSMTFELYDDESGETLLWSETHSDILVSKGLFSVELGASDDFDTLSFAREYWLEIEVDGEVLSPREKLTSAPYSIHSEYTTRSIQSVSSETNPTGRNGHIMFVPTSGTSVTESGTEDTIYIAISGMSDGIVADKPLIGTGTAENRLQIDYDDITIGMDLVTEKLIVKDDGITTSQIADATIIRDDLNSDLLTDLDDAETLDGQTAGDFAPIDGSNNYIHNRTDVAQAAGFNIDGNAYIGGNVGIGTTSPATNLHIAKSVDGEFEALKLQNLQGSGSIQTSTSIGFHHFGSTNPSGKIVVKELTAGNNKSQMEFWVRNEASDVQPDVQAVTIKSDGKIGIDNISPSALLTVGDGSSGSGTDIDIIQIQSRGFTGLEIIGDYGNLSGEPGGAYLSFELDGFYDNRRFIGVIQQADKDPLGRDFIGTIDNSMVLGCTQTNHHIQLGAGGAVAMTIRANNSNVGIGTTNPKSKLDISGVIPELTLTNDVRGSWNFGDSFGQLSFYSGDNDYYAPGIGAYIRASHLRPGDGHSAGDMGLEFGVNAGDWTNPASTAMVIGMNGNVGIGTTEPSYRLELPNTANVSGRGRANSWVTYSSSRWKENIQPIQDPIGKVKNITGVSFNWKEKNGGTQDIGFIAEDIGKVIPEIVDFEDDGIYAKGMDYAKVTPILVEAVKEQQTKIETLENLIETQQQQIEVLKALIQK